MVLPSVVLRAVLNGPALVELKNGDSYSGTLVAVDNLMNVRLEDALYTPRDEERFLRLKECILRGKYVKFIRFADDILDNPSLQPEPAFGYDSKGYKGRGKGGKSKGKGEVPGPTRMTVPSLLVGAIIGRGGDTIRRFCLESGARIEVSKASPEESSSPSAEDERAIFLSGSPECVERARALINALVQERSTTSEQVHHRSVGGGRGGGGCRSGQSQQQGGAANQGRGAGRKNRRGGQE
eukprot:TRINITY_DN71582_c0_g1_i1.p1 TRINITY_DN71582_c0_g1~~TRINITY_DN71582_c0_g1_i1.p1  ORF type:complete len:239 (+),score=32.15 TRINITY_DN71582_c0_g1_i1:183-899(+)